MEQLNIGAQMKRVKRWCTGLSVFTAVAWMVVIIPTITRRYFHLSLLWPCLGFLAALAGTFALTHAMDVYRRLVSGLTERQTGEAASLGELIETIMPQEQTASRPVVRQIASRLQQLEPEDSHSLTTRHRSILYRYLLPRPKSSVLAFYDKEFILAIIHALTRIGDNEALPAIQRLAESARDEEIRAAAVASLPALHACQKQQSLLRPSLSPGAEQTLLRPTGGVQTDPYPLVRPVEEESSNRAREDVS